MPYTPRKEIRVPLKGNIVYSVGFTTQGGTVRDISRHGCLVESDRPPHPASMLSCRILLPGLSEPVEVQLALVQWVLGNHFGLKIVDMGADTQKRLRRFLDDNYLQLARAKRGRGQSRTGSSTSPQSVILNLQSGPLSPDSLPQGGLALPDSDPETTVGCLDEPVAILPHDLSAFVGWILDARHAFEAKEPMPTAPMLEFEEFKACTQFIQTLLDQSQASQSCVDDSSANGHSQHEVMAHLLTQLKSDQQTLHGAPAQPVEDRGSEEPSADENLSPLPEDRPERRARVRRSVPRVNNRSSLPLSVRLARWTAKFKLPGWFARA